MALRRRVSPSIALVFAALGSTVAAASCGGSSLPAAAHDGGSAEASTSDASVADGGENVAPLDGEASDAAVADSAAMGDRDAGGCTFDGGVPDSLACTGLYSDWATKTIAPGVTAYEPALLFWSDGAVKSRWLYLPPGGQIDTTDPDNWVFPVETKIWKQFVVVGQLIETRLLWKTGTFNWTFVVYRWSADGSSATRLDDGETHVNGTTYEVPSVYACPQCHDGRNDEVLGIDLLGTGLPAAQGVTLDGLAAAGRLIQPAPVTVALPEDSTGKAAAALGWLHVNCGVSCHNRDANALAQQTNLFMKLTASALFPDAGAPQVGQTDTYATAVNVSANLTPNGMHYLRIAPGMSAESLLPIMDLTRDPDGGFEQMPPLLSHVADTAGVARVQAWIDAL